MSGLSRRSYIYAGLEGTIRGGNTVCPRIDVKCIFRVPLLSYASSGGRSRDSKDDTRVVFLSLSLSPSHSISSVHNHNMSKFPPLKLYCAPLFRKIPRYAFFFFFFFHKRKEIRRCRSIITRTRDLLILLNRHREETFSSHVFYRCVCLRYTINDINILNIITTRFDSRLLYRICFFYFSFFSRLSIAL